MSTPAGTVLSTLSLAVEIDRDPDWPTVVVRVDGHDPFTGVAPGWGGFDPDDLLRTESPLVPGDLGRRVAVHRCSCGEAGCGVIAPFIIASPDPRTISWVDFRNYSGVFFGPVATEAIDDDGRPWALPDLHFDRDQYLTEVRRATADRSWETPRRVTARLLQDRLRPLKLVLPPDLALARVWPAWEQDGVDLSFENWRTEPGDRRPGRRLLRLRSSRTDPAEAAADLADQLLSAAPGDWWETFSYQP